MVLCSLNCGVHVCPRVQYVRSRAAASLTLPSITSFQNSLLTVVTADRSHTLLLHSWLPHSPWDGCKGALLLFPSKAMCMLLWDRRWETTDRPLAGPSLGCPCPSLTGLLSLLPICWPLNSLPFVKSLQGLSLHRNWLP